jgi:hypothetical protein
MGRIIREANTPEETAKSSCAVIIGKLVKKEGKRFESAHEGIETKEEIDPLGLIERDRLEPFTYSAMSVEVRQSSRATTFYSGILRLRCTQNDGKFRSNY